MSGTLAAILGGAAGAVALVGIIIIIWFCLSHKKSVSRTSETGSSEPSIQVGRHVGVELSLREARRFEMEELSLATKNFSDKNLIGVGKFGEVYKGLLNDGMLVAIKKRRGVPSQEFVDEVRYLSPIQHRNLVTLLGYCQENDQQLLLYEYIPSGSVSNHLYGSGQVSDGKLEFKLRLSIALGAAKGLAYLHSLSPRLIHKDFKTSNVLVDETFVAKVADAGLRNFLGRVDIAGPSSQVTADEIFLAPEYYLSDINIAHLAQSSLFLNSHHHLYRVREFRRFSEKSDVFSFGIFLLELLSGQEAASLAPDSSQSLAEWVQNTEDYSRFSSIIDQRMGDSFTGEAMEEFIHLMIRCLEPSSERRPTMSYVVMALERVVEKEMSMTTVMGEGTPTVTLGSQLFRTMK